MDLRASLPKKQESRPGSPGRLSPLSSLVKGRVEGVEVFGIQLVGEDAEALAEATNLSKARQAQVFPGVGVFGRGASPPLRHPSNRTKG